MFFLSNVTEGGELAFQIADNATFSHQVITPAADINRYRYRDRYRYRYRYR